MELMKRSPRCAYNGFLSLINDKWIVDEFHKLRDDEHPQISPEELVACEMVVRADPRVQAIAKGVGECAPTSFNIKSISV